MAGDHTSIAGDDRSTLRENEIHDQVKTGPPGAEEFFSGLLPGAKKDPDTQAPGKIGLAVPAGVVADAEGNAVVTIRNQGDQAAVPVVKYKDREVYRCSRALEPGEAVKVKIPFGPGSGEEKFETTMETSSVNGFGVGMSVVSKVLFQG